MTTAPRMFSMHLPQATLVFEPGDDEYAVYSTPPSTTFDWSQWDAMREGLVPTGHIPLTDVEFDDTSGFRVHTMGIERFAVPT